MGKKMSNGDVCFLAVVGSNSQNPEQPPQVIPGYGDKFAPVIGKIIGQWAVLEQEIEILITALLKFRNTTNIGWQKKTFKKRWELLNAEWNLFVGTDLQLKTEMFEANQEVSSAKVIRDSISHKRILFGLDDISPWIRFQNKNPGYPWTRKYRQEDFGKIHSKIVMASGRLYRFTNLKYSQHFSSQSKSLLQQLPNMDYLRFPMSIT